MDYKKILKNENTRYKILRFFSWVPDKFMLKFQYKIKTGRKLDIDNPRRYTEKLQWMKCYYRDELMKKCADKWNVREYVQERNLGCILNHSYGVFESVEKIPWEILPNEFVIKDTLGGGGRSIIIVRDKKKIKMNNVISIINAWLNTSVEKKNLGREWVYDNRKHRILIEDLLIADENGDLPDYKFFCFNGKVYCLYMMKNYTLHHDQ